MNTLKLPDNKYQWAVFYLILAIALFYNLGVINLQFEEPRRAVVAIEMDITGNYLVPKINGFNYYNKPPIYNWLLIILTKLFNSYENWVYRLPTVLSLLGMAFINFKIIKEKISKEVAIYSSLLLITSGNILFYFSFMGEIDMFYSLIVYVQILCLLHYFEKKDYARLFLFSYVLTAIGGLTKGIPSFAFQAITILSLFLFHKRYKQLFSVWNFVGIIIMVLLLIAYFFPYHEKENAMPYITRLISESSRRAMGTTSWLKSLVHLYKFPLLLIGMMAPWSLMLPLKEIKTAWNKAMENQWVKLISIFLLPNILLYWLSAGTMDRYLYMFLPFILVLIVYLYSLSQQKYFQHAGILLYVLGILLVFVIPFYAKELPLSQGLLVSGFLLFISVSASYVYFKHPDWRVFVLVAFLLCGRITYNFLVLPIRSLHRLPFPDYVEQLIAYDVKGFQSIEKVEMAKNPFLLEEVPIEMIDHPPFQLSFYYAKATGTVLSYLKNEVPGEAYIIKLSLLDDKKHYVLLDTLNINQGNGAGKYLVYKVPEN